MTLSIRKCLIAIMMAASVAVSAAESITDLPTKTVNGKTYYYYEVQPKESVYSLCRRFNISKEELLRYNPSVSDGLKAGQDLLFPYSTSVNVSSVTTSGVNTASVRTYEVQKGDTGYGISRKFNISLDDFYSWNPDAKDGVRAGQTVVVSSSVPASPIQAMNTTPMVANGTRTHVIGDHETLYKIAQDNGITVGDILALNPSLDAAYYQSGTTILLPSVRDNALDAGTSMPSTSVMPDGNIYIAKEYDTFYSVATGHGISVEQLQAANPDVDMIQAGMEIIIPQACAEQGTAPELLAKETGDTLTVAIALPLMLSQQQRTKQAQLYLEFYKGFLLAVDSLRNIGKPLRILTYDTQGSMLGASQVLTDPMLATAKVIIAPEQPDQLTMFADYGRRNNINVLNLFVVKNDAYLSNPNVMHANIPHDAMYSKAIDYFVANAYGYTPVILSRNEGARDKQEFVDKLKARLQSDGKEYLEINYTGELTPAQLAQLEPARGYVFIPVSSKHDEFTKATAAILELNKENTYNDRFRLWGYPEWLTFRGDLLTNMHDLNTYIFSRFYTGVDDYATKEIDDRFTEWYGGKMAAAVPNQGVFGFDTGMFLIKALNANDGDFSRFTPSYDGVQNGFNFINAAPGGGWINDEMYIIHYTPAKTVNKMGL